MLQSLRNRLILSHALPLLLVIPIMGIVLVYVLETQYVFPTMLVELQEDAVLVTGMLTHHDEAWQDPVAAQALLGEPLEEPPKEVMLLTTDGIVLASNDLANRSLTGRPVGTLGSLSSLETEPQLTSGSDPVSGQDVVEILNPVVGDTGEAIGFVRLTHEAAPIPEDLAGLRDLIGTILLAGLAIGGLIGALLAVNLNRPLQEVTQVIYEVARGERRDALQEQGPEEMRLLLAAVNYLMARLHELEVARRQLLANLVRELGRPLGAVRTALHAIQRGADPQLTDDLLNGMDDAMGQLQFLVEDLSRLHDQAIGPLELNRQALAVGQWLPVVLRPWQALAEEKGRHWQSEIPENLPNVWVDQVRLAQAIGNLVSNAVKFTPRGGLIAVSAAATRHEFVLQVADTGPGITREEQALIFRPLYRGGQERRIKQGMGLGLGIANDLVAGHGGRITVESAAGDGSCFTIHLPLDQPLHHNNGSGPREDLS